MGRFRVLDGPAPGHLRSPAAEYATRHEGALTAGSPILNEALAAQKYGYLPMTPAAPPAPEHTGYRFVFPGQAGYTIIGTVHLFKNGLDDGLVMQADILSAAASSYYGAWIPEYAMQGYEAQQGWQSNNTGEQKWLSCTLAVPTAVRAARLYCSYGPGGYRPANLEVYSGNGGSFNVARASLALPWVEATNQANGIFQADVILTTPA